MAKRRTFTPKFKVQVVLEVLSGIKNTAEACREYGLHAQVLNRWKTEFLEQAHTIFENGSSQSQEQERVAELERFEGLLLSSTRPGRWLEERLRRKPPNQPGD